MTIRIIEHDRVLNRHYDDGRYTTRFTANNDGADGVNLYVSDIEIDYFRRCFADFIVAPEVHPIIKASALPKIEFDYVRSGYTWCQDVNDTVTDEITGETLAISVVFDVPDGWLYVSPDTYVTVPAHIIEEV